METIKQFNHNEYSIDIFIDEFAESPREQDPLGTILYVSSRYTLGDKRVEADEINEILERNDIISLPVFAYIHSNVMLNTTGFSCRFDSGKSGIIYCETSLARNEYPNLNDLELIKVIKERLNEEVKLFSKYLNGEIYGYTVKDHYGFNENSEYGFYNIEEAIESAKKYAEEVFIPRQCMDNRSNICFGTVANKHLEERCIS